MVRCAYLSRRCAPQVAHWPWEKATCGVVRGIRWSGGARIGGALAVFLVPVLAVVRCRDHWVRECRAGERFLHLRTAGIGRATRVAATPLAWPGLAETPFPNPPNSREQQQLHFDVLVFPGVAIVPAVGRYAAVAAHHPAPHGASARSSLALSHVSRKNPRPPRFFWIPRCTFVVPERKK